MKNTHSFQYKTNLKKKSLATIIDYSIYLLVYFHYIDYFGTENDEGGKTVTGLLFLPLPLFWFFYFVITEAVWGATPAHLGLNLKVVTIERKEINWIQAFKRRILDFIDILFYGIPAIISIKKSEKHQRLGDLWAETIVVDITDPEQYIESPKHV